MTTEHGPAQVGLQVVALGKGEFGGMAYWGGLPGWGYDRQHRWPVSGFNYEQETHLASELGLFKVPPEGETKLVGTLDGKLLGTFRKVERESPSMGARPPANAVILFDGTASKELVKPRLTPEGWLSIGTATTRSVSDFHMHVEFRTPFMPEARGQARGNSGVYIQGRYEVQILDSFGLDGINNECGGLYKTRAPDVNMCLPPLVWQTYDIDFQAARFGADGKKASPARLTVRHNGCRVHRDVEIPNKTGGGEQEGPAPRPIKLQDHGNPVVFRNVWLTEGVSPPMLNPPVTPTPSPVTSPLLVSAPWCQPCQSAVFRSIPPTW